MCVVFDSLWRGGGSPADVLDSGDLICWAVQHASGLHGAFHSLFASPFPVFHVILFVLSLLEGQGRLTKASWFRLKAPL